MQLCEVKMRSNDNHLSYNNVMCGNLHGDAVYQLIIQALFTRYVHFTKRFILVDSTKKNFFSLPHSYRPTSRVSVVVSGLYPRVPFMVIAPVNYYCMHINILLLL